MWKRIVDLIVATLALVILIPVMSLLILVVYLDVGWPVIFSQTRAGYKGRPFKIYKFHTMSNATGSDGNLLPDEQHITRLGRFLRRTSLDELPELWNVIKGDMSLVGPRPLLMEYLTLYTPRQAKRHDMKPGITGLAQISGRNSLSWEEKFELDVKYVENWSLWLDLKILAKTLVKVFTGEGVSAPGHATMPPFTGSRSLNS